MKTQSFARRASILVWWVWVAGCGAQTDSSTGGKTNWLSPCEKDADCRDLPSAICAEEVCTKSCDDDTACDFAGDLHCANVEAASSARACLPQCEGDGCAEPDPSTTDDDDTDDDTSDDDTTDDDTTDDDTSDDDASDDDASDDDASDDDSITDDDASDDDSTAEPAAEPTVEPTAEPSADPNFGVCTDLMPVFAGDFLPDFESIGSSHGAPACSNGCPYRYDGTEDAWVPSDDLQCPMMSQEQCDEELDRLWAADRGCEVDDDCALWGGVTESAACSDEFVWPTLIVSLLSSEADLGALRAAFDDLVLHGCGRDTEPDERPALAVCEDGVCGMGPEQDPPCGQAPSEDAGLPDAGEP